MFRLFGKNFQPLRPDEVINVVELNKRQLGLPHKFRSEKPIKTEDWDSSYDSKFLKLESSLQLPTTSNCADLPIQDLSFKHDGSYFISNHDYRKLSIWDWSDQKFLTDFKFEYCSGTKILNFPTISRIALIDLNNCVCLLDTERNNYSKLFKHKNFCVDLIHNPDNPFVLISADYKGQIVVHDIRRSRSHIIPDHKGSESKILSRITRHPKNEYELSIASESGPVVRLDYRYPNNILSEYGTDYQFMNNVSYNHDGSEILVSNDRIACNYYVNYPTNCIYGITACDLKYLYFGKHSKIIVGRKNDLTIFETKHGEYFEVTKRMSLTSMEKHPVQDYLCTGDSFGCMKIWSFIPTNFYDFTT